MIPILFPHDEMAFESNGLGHLPDAVDVSITHQLNGEYELQMKYPLDGLNADKIADMTIIMCEPDPVTAPQPFRIYQIQPSSNGMITVFARHLVYDLIGIPVSPFTAESLTSAGIKLVTSTPVPCDFNFRANFSADGAFKIDTPRPVWKVLGGAAGSFLDVYGGEYEFDGRDVILHRKIGSDQGVTIRYGKNLRTLEMDRSCAEVYTGVYPFWTRSDGDKKALAELPEKIINAEGTYLYTRIRTLDLSQEWEAAPTADQLRERAKKWMKDNDIGIPRIRWKINFAQLEQYEEFKDSTLLERVALGDTVEVIFKRMGVNARARVVETVYDPLRRRYKHITLGRVKSSFADTVVDQQNRIEAAPTTSEMERAVAAATAWLTNGKGHKVERLDSTGNVVDTLYMDTSDANTAVNVLRIGQSGIGFSKTGVNGPYESAWTLDGKFNASFILAGTLAASLLVGRLSSKDGTSWIDLDKNLCHLIGEIETLTAQNGEIESEAELTGKGLSFRSRTLWGGMENSAEYEARRMAIPSDFGRIEDTNSGLTGSAGNQPAITRGITYNGVGQILDEIAGHQQVTESGNGNPTVERIYANQKDGTRITVRLQSGRAYITGLTGPVSDSDAANKAYVDEQFRRRGL